MNEWRGKAEVRPRFREERRGCRATWDLGMKLGQKSEQRRGNKMQEARGKLWREKWWGSEHLSS